AASRFRVVQEMDSLVNLKWLLPPWPFFRLFGSGRMTLSQVLSHAVALADEGYPVAPLTAQSWARQETLLKVLPSRPCFPPWGAECCAGEISKGGHAGLRSPYFSQTASKHGGDMLLDGRAPRAG